MKTKVAIPICLALLAIILAAFWPAGSYGFISLDDPLYVESNRHVREGLSGESVRWAFTTFHAAYWHPLTWLSLMLDAQLFGPEPQVFHRVNIVLHAISAILLFLALSRATGSVWKSAFAAALFAVHPLRVESVVWITERKDVLGTLFWMLTTLAYVRYARGPSAGRYAAVIVAFALGLMAKPMLVTLPLVLLLLDYWPLDRIRRQTAWRCVAEKLPLLALAAGSSALTWIAVRQGGSAQSLDYIPLVERSANALLSYVAYIGKLFWPVDLALFYPHPLERGVGWQALGAAILLAAVTLAAIRLRGSWPWLAVGWFWYLGTLVPVIGLLQVSTQAMADRFTYIPHVGLIILTVWGLCHLARGIRRRELVLGAVGCIALVSLIVRTQGQTRHWRDSESLYNHTLAVTEENYYTRVLLAEYLDRTGRTAQAIDQFREAIAIRADYAHPYVQLADLYEEGGRFADSERMYVKALEIEPENVHALNNHGFLLFRAGRFEQAVAQWTKAVELDSEMPEVLNNLGAALARLNRHEEALGYYARALEQAPEYADAHLNRGRSSLATGRTDDAIASLQRTIELNPRRLAAHELLMRAYAWSDRPDLARAHFDRLSGFDPSLADQLARKLRSEN